MIRDPSDVELLRLANQAATATIDASRNAFEAALRSGDASAAASIYADDATLVAPAAEVLHGRPAIERFWRTGVETGIESVTLARHDLQLQGEIAFEVGSYALYVASEADGPIVDRGRYLIVHRVEPDGIWRRAAEMFSPDQAPSPEPV